MIFFKRLMSFSWLLIACSCGDPGSNKPHLTTPYILPIPQGFPQPALPSDNELTEESIILGRLLFYDPILSLDSSQSCSSCHNPSFGFTDNGNKYSTGVDGSVSFRNSMPLHDLAWGKQFAWDGGMPSLREQALEPIQNPTEMKESMLNVVEKLKRQPLYEQAFNAAYGDSEINPDKIGLALEQFMLIILSGGSSKFDNVNAGIESFTTEEQLGVQLFNAEANPDGSPKGADCFHCHGGALFTNNTIVNNGLDSIFTDLGKGGITNLEVDNGKFKVPSLRNLAYTPPYMHDGRFQTLEEVLEFYNSNVLSNSPNLAPGMTGFVQSHSSGEQGLNLSLSERQAIVAFLNTLTDTRIETDTLYQNPFK
jgi:cytochrome c peroxidase